jgi:hypothetical protein
MKTNNKSHNASGFKAPDNYFDGFEDRLFSKISSEKEPLEKKPSGFNIPDGYFNTVEDNVFAKLNLEERVEETSTSNAPIIRLNYWYLSAIAAILIVCMMVINLQQTNTLTFDTIEITSIEDALEEGYLDVSLSDITSLYENTELTASFDVDDDALLEFLENNIDDQSFYSE